MFDLVLVHMKETVKNLNVSCTKKNMYDSDLKYIAISYRWGEDQEQYVKTPDSTSHITSFYLNYLIWHCINITGEPKLKEIPYLWIDAILAFAILAIPDLHIHYLLSNTANEEIMKSAKKYNHMIYNDIYSTTSRSTPPNNNMNNNNRDSKYKPQTNNDHHYSVICKLMTYLVQDWSNCTWVISEYQIAKEN
ncbi:unnamed protein product [Cunninghamella blakesleeana]